MATYAVVDVETVLTQGDGSFIEREASDTGKLLYASLLTHFNVVLVHDQDEEKADHWLRSHGFGGWVLLRRGVVPEVHDYLRRTLGALDLWVTGDPPTGRHLLREGLNVLLFSQAAYRRKEWRPDHDRVVRTWDVIQEEVSESLAMRVSDKRLSTDANGRFE